MANAPAAITRTTNPTAIMSIPISLTSLIRFRSVRALALSMRLTNSSTLTQSNGCPDSPNQPSRNASVVSTWRARRAGPIAASRPISIMNIAAAGTTPGRVSKPMPLTNSVLSKDRREVIVEQKRYQEANKCTKRDLAERTSEDLMRSRLECRDMVTSSNGDKAPLTFPHLPTSRLTVLAVIGSGAADAVDGMVLVDAFGSNVGWGRLGSRVNRMP
jgi:hypothetical protein